MGKTLPTSSKQASATTSKSEAATRSIESLLADRDRLEHLVISNSCLPSPRANLEFASTFADVFGTRGYDAQLWSMLLDWSRIAAHEANTNSPREYLPFCALPALGLMALSSDSPCQETLVCELLRAASDPRWRTREAVAIALQRIGERDWSFLRRFIEGCMPTAGPWVQRAILAGLAHPPLLISHVAAVFALDVADEILRAYARADRETLAAEPYRVLHKGLDYALSVFVAACPEDGFRFLGQWARHDEVEVKKVIAANLRKARLYKAFPEQVEEVGLALGES